MLKAVRMNTKPRYHLRLLERFVIYDPDRGLLLWREWAAGQIVTDPEQIELLTARGAPVERIEIHQGDNQP
jgi:hypothetical protein